MRIKYLILVFALCIVMPQATAQNLDDILKGLTQGNTNDQNAPPAAASQNKPAFNLSNPSMEEEIQIGREIMGNLLGAAPLVKDAMLQKYVNQVGRWVAKQSERANLPWHFGVIESADINAFAAPGGYVIITKGLYRKLENEAQLAGGARA